MRQVPLAILMLPSGRVRTNAVQLPRAQDESQWALVSISPWESSRDDEKGHVTAGTWPLAPSQPPRTDKGSWHLHPHPWESPRYLYQVRHGAGS